MRARLATAAIVAVALALPASAAAGGFATVGIDAPPRDVEPGATWPVEITVLQHGITPATFGEPRVVLDAPAGRQDREFAAKPTNRPGVYRAEVELPPAGRWGVAVVDGFGARHTFPAIDVGGAPAAAAATTTATDAGGTPWLPLAAALAAGLLAAALVLLVRPPASRRTPVPG